MATTKLSKRGGFVTRRNIKMLARNELSSIVSARAESFSTHFQDPLDRVSAADTTTATPTTSAFACPRLCGPTSSTPMPCGSYWVLSAVLLILTVSYLPSGVAAPRRARGIHLILPHHHHHVHLRSAGQEQHHPALNCQLNMDNYNADNLELAFTIAKSTRESAADLLKTWLSDIANGGHSNEASAEKQYQWHHLELDYPLQVAANNSNFIATDEKSKDEDLKDILGSLNSISLVLHDANSSLTFESYNSTFRHIYDKVEHNRSMVKRLLNCENHSPNENVVPSYKHKHPKLHYAIAKEFIKILTVLEKMYIFRHGQQKRLESEKKRLEQREK